MERTAEYQLNAQKDYYVNHLKLLRLEMESIIKQKNNEIKDWKKLIKKQELDKEMNQKKNELDKNKIEQKMKNHAEKRLLEHTLLYEAKCSELELLQKELKNSARGQGKYHPYSYS